MYLDTILGAGVKILIEIHCKKLDHKQDVKRNVPRPLLFTWNVFRNGLKNTNVTL